MCNHSIKKVNLQTFPVARPNEQRHAIHDQLVFMNGKMRELCYEETGIKPATFVQMKGDAVFIPAGAPHMVSNALVLLFNYKTH